MIDPSSPEILNSSNLIHNIPLLSLWGHPHPLNADVIYGPKERESERARKGKGVRDVDVTLRVSARGESVNGPIAFSTKGAREEGRVDR